jgi:hypothetical protein
MSTNPITGVPNSPDGGTTSRSHPSALARVPGATAVGLAVTAMALFTPGQAVAATMTPLAQPGSGLHATSSEQPGGPPSLVHPAGAQPVWDTDNLRADRQQPGGQDPDGEEPDPALLAAADKLTEEARAAGINLLNLTALRDRTAEEWGKADTIANSAEASWDVAFKARDDAKRQLDAARAEVDRLKERGIGNLPLRPQDFTELDAVKLKAALKAQKELPEAQQRLERLEKLHAARESEALEREEAFLNARRDADAKLVRMNAENEVIMKAYVEVWPLVDKADEANKAVGRTSPDFFPGRDIRRPGPKPGDTGPATGNAPGAVTDPAPVDPLAGNPQAGSPAAPGGTGNANDAPMECRGVAGPALNDTRCDLRPGQPDQQEQPRQQGQPGQPGQPDQAEQPNQPETPDQQQAPGQQHEPGQPQAPGQQQAPDQPEAGQPAPNQELDPQQEPDPQEAPDQEAPDQKQVPNEQQAPDQRERQPSAPKQEQGTEPADGAGGTPGTDN